MQHEAWIHTFVLLVAAMVGIGIGVYSEGENGAAMLIEPFLMAMLFFVFVCVEPSDLMRSFENRRFTATALFINFVWSPIFAIIIGRLFFSGNLDMRIGLLLLLCTPCTDWYLVFTSLARGNVPLSSSILPLNLIIQVVLLPVYLMLFFGTEVGFDIFSMLSSAAVVIVLPLAAALILRMLAHRKNDVQSVQDLASANAGTFQLVFLCMAIAAMFASQSAVLMENLELLLILVMPLLVYFAVNSIIAIGMGQLEGYSYADTSSLLFTTLARNSPLALAICASVFTDCPLILMALVIGPLIELPVLSVISSLRAERSPSEEESPA